MDEHAKKIGIPVDHRLMQTDAKWEQRKGQDTDIYWYDELDSAGGIVAKYIVRVAMSIYPPQRSSTTYEKVG